MGREVRMVPKDWQHPMEDGRYIPQFEGGRYKDALSEWNQENDQWSRGIFPSYASDEYKSWSYSEYAGDQPKSKDYMPDWSAEEKTHFMMYEDTSEGTPISPAFETAEELAQWLADTGASSFGSSTATYEQWLATIKRGWACSAVVDSSGVHSGVEALG